MKRIMLKCHPTGWVAYNFRWVPFGWAPDADIVSLFGTHALPTPYGPSVPPVTVTERIQALNRGIIVDAV